ncbi:MAG: 23S rRNA (adenine(2503)-C(2))-methyltransferase RlmN [Nitrospirae bacterium]|nr:23S rRNA (adenine(2503)-C(2))-methyltransferase RlmN [Nitrospirota bacterium]
MDKVNLRALSSNEIKEFVSELGLPDYRAGQILRWIYVKSASRIDEMTDLSKDLRLRLDELSYLSSLELIETRVSRDGTKKFLFGLEDGNKVESVLIPDEDRLTLCISSQVGCALACRFCLTGRMGLKRNLRAFEIIEQVISARRLSPESQITNIVLMGMGEPLMNFTEVIEALFRLTELMHFPTRKITLSTAGIVPKILKLSETAPHVNLAVSLNATTDKVRDFIMPVNRKYPIKALIGACRSYSLQKRRRITFEYVLLDGINNKEDDAKRLVRLIKGIPSKVNLIPFNEYDGCEFKRPSDESTLKFQDILISSGLTALIRKSKGKDIMAACGQLSVIGSKNSGII